MSDTIQLVPSVPVVSRIAPVRPEQQIEPASESRSDNRTGDNGRGGDSHAGQQSRHLTISRSDTLGTFVYRSIDQDSGDVVWQYPNEGRLRMSQHLQELEEQKSRHNVDEKA